MTSEDTGYGHQLALLCVSQYWKVTKVNWNVISVYTHSKPVHLNINIAKSKKVNDYKLYSHPDSVSFFSVFWTSDSCASVFVFSSGAGSSEMRTEPGVLGLISNVLQTQLSHTSFFFQ